MDIPTLEEFAAARSAIDGRGQFAPETLALGVAAIRDPTLGDILDKQVKLAIQTLRTPSPELVRGILTGVFISGLNLGLTVREK